jgi:hypothetical protein
VGRYSPNQIGIWCPVEEVRNDNRERVGRGCTAAYSQTSLPQPQTKREKPHSALTDPVELHLHNINLDSSTQVDSSTICIRQSRHHELNPSAQVAKQTFSCSKTNPSCSPAVGLYSKLLAGMERRLNLSKTLRSSFRIKLGNRGPR